MKALRFRLPLNSNSELKKTELLSAVPSELAPLPHCVLKWGFTRTFPGNQEATLNRSDIEINV